MSGCGRFGFALVSSLACCLAGGPPIAAADYYQGKMITVLVGNAPGGGYDAYARLLAQYMGRHIPGAPSFVVKNMPEGGGIALANHVAFIAPRDGLTIGFVPKQIPFEPLFGNTAARYKDSDLTWLGTISSYANDAYLLFVRADTPFQTLDDLRKPGAPSHFGSSAVGSLDADVLQISKAVFHLNIDMVRGYKGAGEMGLAMQRDEIEGMSTGMSSIQIAFGDWLKNNRLRFLLMFGHEKRWDRMPDVPTAHELATTPEDIELIDLLEYSLRLARPVLAPPKLPPEEASILKRAFVDTNADPEYLADAERMHLDVSPIDGDTMTKMLGELESIPPAVVARYRQITQPH